MHSLEESAAATAATESAVIVPVPAAEALVGVHRRRWDRSAGWGVPAHVTVLYPFVPPESVDEAALTRLSAVLASVPAFDCTFATTAWFGTEVLWLAPQPSEPLRQLMMAVWRAFPDHPPYAGVHDHVQPHLTVAERALGNARDVEAAERDIQAGLPVTQHIDHALLIAGARQPRSWRTLHRIDLGRTGDC